MRLSLEDELQVIEKRKKGIKLKQIMEEYNISKFTIYSILKRGGSPKKIGNKKYSIDDTFFEKIDTSEKSYWLGFIYADGCVCEQKNSKLLQLKLSLKDKKHLQLFSEVISSNYPIREFVSKNNHFYKDSIVPENRRSLSESAYVRISNSKIVDDIIDKGCIYNKTFKLKFPEFLSENLENHFIRGYFDGDGCVYKANYKNKRNIDIVGCYEFIQKLSQKLQNRGINNIKIQKQGSIYRLRIYRFTETLKFFRLIYSDNPTCFLERKRDIFTQEYFI